ncbi:AbiV family abortive infection protein [Pseudomonas brassicacearum]|uniref:AbiV family abortive infection protein n=1 Tax=Pseudomonas brassicacearum TaxID=930166 RepID=UPI0005A54D66|nr:AbiV family abortive infection protein [Pseudomonas brassicacearum]
MHQKLEIYKGPLSNSKIADGINAASANALRLACDARLLLDAGRYPSAISLAALSIEESGKISILRTIAFAATPQELKAEWRRYRTHTSKNVSWILPQLAAQGAKFLNDLRPLFDDESDHPQLLDQLKQLGFYTDCLGAKANWSKPEEVIDPDLATTLVRTAEILAPKSSVSEREIELWVEHLGPVWKKNENLMRLALVSWYRSMQEEGLKEAGSNKMEKFVFEASGD